MRTKNNEKVYTIPPKIIRLLPPEQLKYTVQNIGVFYEDIKRIYKLLPKIPCIGETETEKSPTVYLHYFTGTADYYICEYDGDDTMYGHYKFNTFQFANNYYHKFSLSNLKSNQFIQLDFGWGIRN